MDEQLTYARKLQASGYTLTQIRDTLQQQNADERTIFVVLNNLAAHSAGGSTLPPPPLAAQPVSQPAHTRTLVNTAAYVKYVREALARGLTWKDIDKAITAQGIGPQDREGIYAAARTPDAPLHQDFVTLANEPTPLATQPAIGAAPTAPAEPPAPVTDAAGTLTIPHSPPPQVPQAPPAPQPPQVPQTPPQVPQPPLPPPANARQEPSGEAEEKLAEAADRLGTVVDHLSAVVDKLDEEVHQGAAHTAPEISTAEPKPAGADPTEQLAAVTDHLNEVVDKLEDDIKRPPPPPPTPPSTPNATVAEIAATLPPHETPEPPHATQPVIVENEPAPATDASEQVPRPALKINPIWLIAGTCIYTVILIQSLRTSEKSITWLALLSMNVFGTVAYNLLLKRSEWKKVDQWVTAAVMQTGLAIPFLVKEIIRPIHFPAFTPFEYMLMAFCIVALITLQICNVKALKHLEASVYSVIFNSRIMLATLFGAFFLSESIGIWALLGGTLIFLAIFVVKQKSTRSVTTLGVLFSLGAALAMSSMNTCEKELIKLVGYQQYVFPVWTIAAVLMWIIVISRRTAIPYKMIFHPQGLSMMAVRAFAGIGFTASLMFGPLAVSSYISSLSVVFLVICGMLFFGEWDYLRSKIIATATSFVGLTFILIDSL